MYNNYTADDNRARRRLSLYESSIWGPQTSEHRVSVDLNSNEISTLLAPDQLHPPGPLMDQSSMQLQNRYDLAPLSQGQTMPGQNSVPAYPPNFAAQSMGGRNNLFGPNFAGQNYYGQNYAGQNYAGQNYAGQNFTGQNFAALNYAGQPYPGQNYPGQNYPESFSNSPQQSPSQVAAGPDQGRPLGGDWSFGNLQSNPTAMRSRSYPLLSAGPNLWNGLKDQPLLFPGAPLQGVALAVLLAPAPNVERVQTSDGGFPALSASFMQGVSLNELILQPVTARRHSYGDGFGLRRQSAPVGPVSTPQENSAESQTLAAVHEYFSLDPHERVTVTAEYLQQRCFEEEKYLDDLYQLPKFPMENQLRNYLLVLVGFKAGRIDVFYLPGDVDELQKTKVGDLVIVEADRGRDLGKIVKMNISIDEARLLKLLQHLEQQASLSDHVTVNDLSVKSLQTSGSGHHGHHGASAPPTLHFPKPILSLAQSGEVSQILSKKQDEERACRLCLAKIESTTNNLSSGHSHGTLTSSDLMQMKLLDAEYQFDRRKLIFYYSTSKRIDFRDLVRELFRIYKTRIWMCAASGIPYTPQQKTKAKTNQGRNGNGKNNSSGDNGKNGVANRTQSPNHLLSGQAGRSPDRRFSYQGELSLGASELGVPRNFQACDHIEEETSRDSGESLVLKSLVDTLNH